MEKILKRRLVILTEYFYPSKRNDAFLITEIVKSISSNNNINVICTTDLEDNEEIDFVNNKIFRLKKTKRKFKNIFFRVFDLLLVTFRLILKASFFVKKNDILFTVTNPALLLPFIVLLKKIKKFELVLLVYDVFPNNLVATGLLKDNSLLLKLLKIIFNWSYRNCDKLIVLGRDMEDVLSKTIIDGQSKITIIENWCDPKHIIPMKKDDNEIIKKYKLKRKIVFSFVGNFGLVQGIENLLNAAMLVKNQDFVLLFIGNGAKTNLITDFIYNNNCKNIIYAGEFAPSEKQMFLNACDISIMSLNSSMYGLGVPSKSYNNMSAGKPLFYIGHEKSEIAQVINEYEIGWICNSHNPIEIADKIDYICSENNSFSIFGKRSRDVLEKYYSKDVIMKKYNNFFK